MIYTHSRIYRPKEIFSFIVLACKRERERERCRERKSCKSKVINTHKRVSHL